MNDHKLWLDDVRDTPIGWDCVRSYDEFVKYIETYGVPKVISFDHDLGYEQYPWNYTPNQDGSIPYDSFQEKTGLHCARYLIERGMLPEEFRIHSMNPVGKRNIYAEMAIAYLDQNRPVPYKEWE